MRSIQSAIFAISLSAALTAISACGSGSSNWNAEKEQQLQALAGEISGMIVYEREERIYTAEIGNLNPAYLADGTHPRWSPDGQYIAFLQGNTLMRVAAAGGVPTVLTVIGDPRAITYHPSGQEVWFGDGSVVRAVDVNTLAVRTVLSDLTVRELDLSNDGQHLVATISTGRSYEVIGVNFADGTVKVLDYGCSSSISPDGTLVTSNTSDHDRLLILNWDSAEVAGSITAQGDNRYDNQIWSNAPLWVAAVGDSPADVFVQNVADNRSVQVTAVERCTRADLFVR